MLRRWRRRACPHPEHRWLSSAGRSAGSGAPASTAANRSGVAPPSGWAARTAGAAGATPRCPFRRRATTADPARPDRSAVDGCPHRRMVSSTATTGSAVSVVSWPETVNGTPAAAKARRSAGNEDTGDRTSTAIRAHGTRARRCARRNSSAMKAASLAAVGNVRTTTSPAAAAARFRLRRSAPFVSAQAPVDPEVNARCGSWPGAGPTTCGSRRARPAPAVSRRRQRNRPSTSMSRSAPGSDPRNA